MVQPSGCSTLTLRPKKNDRQALVYSLLLLYFPTRLLKDVECIERCIELVGGVSG
jgi:hypothetical protein